jgi:hypothetical protein
MHFGSGGHTVSISLTDRRHLLRRAGILLAHKPIEADPPDAGGRKPDAGSDVGGQGRKTWKRWSGDLLCRATPFDRVGPAFFVPRLRTIDTTLFAT